MFRKLRWFLFFYFIRKISYQKIKSNVQLLYDQVFTGTLGRIFIGQIQGQY